MFAKSVAFPYAGSQHEARAAVARLFALPATQELGNVVHRPATDAHCAVTATG